MLYHLFMIQALKWIVFTFGERKHLRTQFGKRSLMGLEPRGVMLVKGHLITWVSIKPCLTLTETVTHNFFFLPHLGLTHTLIPFGDGMGPTPQRFIIPIVMGFSLTEFSLTAIRFVTKQNI
jgi:hypothetical protein